MSSAVGRFAQEALDTLASFIKGADFIKDMLETCHGYSNFLTWPEKKFNKLAWEVELQINNLWDNYIPAKKVIRECIEMLDPEAQS